MRIWLDNCVVTPVMMVINNVGGVDVIYNNTSSSFEPLPADNNPLPAHLMTMTQYAKTPPNLLNRNWWFDLPTAAMVNGALLRAASGKIVNGVMLAGDPLAAQVIDDGARIIRLMTGPA